MKILISGKNIEVGDSLRAHIHEAMTALVGRYFKDILECHVNLSKDHHLFLCDLSVHIGRHFVVRTKGENQDAYKCFDDTLEKMESRMNRYRSRLRDRRRHDEAEEHPLIPAARYVINADQQDEPEKDIPVVVAEMSAVVPTVTVSEAVMQMDLSDYPVLMFKNAANGHFNVVYRRADGNIGWIDPSKIL